MNNVFSKKNTIIYFSIVLVVLVGLMISIFVMYNKPFDGTKSAKLVGTYTGNDMVERSFDSDSFNDNQKDYITINANILSDTFNKPYLIFRCYDVICDISCGDDFFYSNRNINKTNSPGYSIIYVPVEAVKANGITITLDDNYNDMIDPKPYSKFFSLMKLGTEGDVIRQFFVSSHYAIIIGVIIIFLGLFGFGFSSTLLSDKENKFYSFAIFAIVSGCYIVAGAIAPYMPLWVNNEFFCMVFDEIWLYILVISISYYLASIMRSKVTRIIMFINVIVSFLLFFIAISLQMLGVADILALETVSYPIVFIANFAEIFCLIYEMKNVKNKLAIIFSISMVPILLSLFLEAINNYFQFVPLRIIIETGMLLSILIQFIAFAIETKRHNEHIIEVEKMEKELVESRLAIMVSQIQPHFLYNSLTSIAVLCNKDPKLAKKTIIEFADYLRANMNSLKEKEPVPFENEFEHIKTYLNLEKLRFDDDLEVEFNIEILNFKVPSLCIQPLVENAIKHGVGMKEDGGKVIISTFEDDNNYFVSVEDNGVGFDINTFYSNDSSNVGSERKHIGIENCRNRLKEMCEGTLVITSEVSVGTKALVSIPKS